MTLTMESLRISQAKIAALNPLAGLRIVQSHECLMTSEEVDRSKVRSLSRAIRRQRKRPLPHLLVPMETAYRVGNMLVMHPLMALELERAAGEKRDE